MCFFETRSVSNSATCATWGWQVQEFHKVSSRHYQAPHADISQHLLTWTGQGSCQFFGLPGGLQLLQAGTQKPQKFTPLTRDDQGSQMATTDRWPLRWRNNDGTGEGISVCHVRRGCEIRPFTAMSEDCHMVPGDICIIGGGTHLTRIKNAIRRYII